MLFFDVSLSEWRNQVKERKPSKQHRMRASIKKSTLKATETRKEGTLPGVNPVDKDKDVYLKAVRYQVSQQVLDRNLTKKKIAKCYEKRKTRESLFTISLQFDEYF